MRKTVTTILLLAALLFGFAACDGPYVDPNYQFGGGGGGGGRLSFRSGTPSARDLSSVGLTPAQFSAINNAAGGGFKGYMSSSGRGRAAVDDSRAAYQGNVYGAAFYACWENRQSGNFKDLIRAVEAQTGVSCEWSINWDDPTWETQMLAKFESDPQNASYIEGFRPSDWYMAMGYDASVLKVWALIWVRNVSAYMGASLKKGDVVWVYMDLSGYLGDLGL